jgi:hypothetical protein
MSLPALTDVLPSIALAISLAACAGFRAWLPLLLAGTLARLGWLDLGQAYRFLASNQALALFGLATVIEVVGDKIPAVDHALDAIGTVLRPAAGSLLAASVIGHVSDPLVALAMGVAVGAPSALVPHAAKSAVRLGSTALTAGLGNPILSVIEDVATICLFAAAVLVPLLVIALLAAAAVLIVRRMSAARPPVTAA